MRLGIQSKCMRGSAWIFFSQMDKMLFDKFFFKSGHIYMKDAKCVETNGKSIFNFWDKPIFILKIDQFWVQKLPYLENWISENWFSIRFSTFRIFHVNLNTFEKKMEFFFMYWNKIIIIMFGFLVRGLFPLIKKASRGWIFF